MRCNQCQSCDTKVIESREVSEGESIRRRRECEQCQNRFTTYERIEKPQLVVIKNDGTRELFSRDKLMAGLIRACEKTPVTTIQIDNIISKVEKDLYSMGESEVRSRQVGELLMEKLATVNEVAYVRFASVYRRFKDIASFEKELSQIRSLKNEKIT